jgi:hypothetical protein
VTSVIGLESPLLAVLACLGFSRKNQPSAFSDFCNTIGQKQTHAPQQTATLFDHLVGADEQDRRDFETERPGGSQIDHQFELGRLYDW